MGESFASAYLAEAAEICARLDADAVDRLADGLAAVRERGGRLFVLGVGGGAGNASHAACDFRKIAGIEAYAPTDNVSELTARINDEGWEGALADWLRVSRLGARDAVLVFSVGGGDLERGVSVSLVRAVAYAREAGALVCGVVGRSEGYTARTADLCVVVPVVNASRRTPHAEAFQAVIWHLLVAHPRLQRAPMKWESLEAGDAPRGGARSGGGAEWAGPDPR